MKIDYLFAKTNWLNFLEKTETKKKGMKLFRNLAKQMVNTANKAVENAAKVDTQDKLRDNLSKRFENVADFLENDRDKEEEK